MRTHRRSNSFQFTRPGGEGTIVIHPWMLILMLSFMSLISFGIAYYLFQNRSASLSIFSPDRFSDDKSKVNLKHCEPLLGDSDFDSCRNNSIFDPLPLVESGSYLAATNPSEPFTTSYPLSSSTKYLAYLHHSGFNNQRISLENAFILAALLNRTLLLPPLRLGTPYIQHHQFDYLQMIHVLDQKTSLKHCITEKYKGRAECKNYDTWTHVSWRSIVDIQGLSEKTGVNVVERWDFSTRFFDEVLNISTSPEDEAIFYLKDTDPREFAFTDTPLPDGGSYKSFMFTIPYEFLSSSTPVRLPNNVLAAPGKARLLHLGTLFGTTRLRLLSPSARTILRLVRSGMIISNEHLLSSARTIASILGDGYVGVHLRVGDGIFEENAWENVREIWWGVLTGLMGLGDRCVADLEDSLQLAREERLSMTSSVPEISARVSSSAPKVPGGSPPLKPPPNPLEAHCTSPHLSLRVLNLTQELSDLLRTPVYMTTDAPHPRSNPLLKRFLQTFPCLFFLNDFVGLSFNDTSPNSRHNGSNTTKHAIFNLSLELDANLTNPHDSTPLLPFFLDTLDALVSAYGARFVGTPKSTYSRYVEDVLWRWTHGLPVVIRGAGAGGARKAESVGRNGTV